MSSNKVVQRYKDDESKSWLKEDGPSAANPTHGDNAHHALLALHWRNASIHWSNIGRGMEQMVMNPPADLGPDVASEKPERPR